jgi:hypothetical protein
MNNAQRKDLTAKLKAVSALYDTLIAMDVNAIEDTKEFVESMAEEEGEKFSNLSEGLQNSEKGQALEEAQNTLNDIAELLAEAQTAFETLTEKLSEAAEHDVP